ncbi:hypothetical protein FWH58_00855 [Candidatus Saccharibacteria bacterium]|nr:hypothetical protein [Candidatus Saccharibacteria bacterium]
MPAVLAFVVAAGGAAVAGCDGNKNRAEAMTNPELSGMQNPGGQEGQPGEENSVTTPGGEVIGNQGQPELELPGDTVLDALNNTRYGSIWSEDAANNTSYIATVGDCTIHAMVTDNARTEIMLSQQNGVPGAATYTVSFPVSNSRVIEQFIEKASGMSPDDYANTQQGQSDNLVPLASGRNYSPESNTVYIDPNTIPSESQNLQDAV